MKAFCSGIGILLLEMKPRQALTGSLPFCAIRCKSHVSSKELSKRDCFENLFYFRQACKHPATRAPPGMFWDESCLVWLLQTSVKQHYGCGRLHLRSDSGQPNPPGSNLQSADDLAQAGLDRADSDLLTDVCRCYTVQMSGFRTGGGGGSPQDAQKGQTGTARGSAYITVQLQVTDVLNIY